MIPDRDHDEFFLFGGFIAAFFIGAGILWLVKLPVRCVVWMWRQVR